MTQKGKIILFGSSFNPPTLAHEAIIRACLGLPRFDQIWLMPSGDRLDKTMDVDDRHRLHMAEIIRTKRFASNPRILVSDFELTLPRPTETFRTAEALAKAYPDLDFWWVLGSDSYLSMPKWRHGLELQQSLNFLVFDRGAADSIKQSNVVHMQLPPSLLHISSTDARRAIASGSGADNWVSQPVLDYIQKHQLYRKH